MLNSVSRLVLFFLLAAHGQPGRAAEIGVRVGVVANQDFDRSAADLERLFDDLGKSTEQTVRFHLAIGTYGDVISWLDKQLIDIALLTPGVFVEALKTDRAATPRCQYLASKLLPPTESVEEGGAAAAAPYRDSYHAACLTAERSPLRNIDDVRRAWQAGRLRFVFVDPLSASGHIAVAFALIEAGIRPSPEQIEYSYSHTNSMRRLGATDGLERLAFVWDGVWTQATDLPPFRRLKFPQFDGLTIPTDVVVARAGFKQADRVIELLTDHTDAQGQHDFARFDDWRARYAELSRWAGGLHVPRDRDEVQGVSLDGVGQMLRHYSRTRPQGHPPRLALVLSGGGAKCAYQIGAVTAVEEQLAAMRQETGDDQLAISLVAGTSGGAINALAIALGTSQTPAGQAELRRAWQSLDQREIVRPSRLVRGNMALWFVCVELAIVLFLARRISLQKRTATTLAPSARRAWSVIAALLVLAAAQIALSYAWFTPWHLLGHWHVLHHAWLWGTFGVEGAGWCLLAVALVAAVWQRWLQRRGGSLALPRWTTTWGLTIALVGLPLAQVLTILFYEQTLSDGQGIERRLLECFSDLAESRAAEVGGPPLGIDRSAATSERLTSVSRQIMARKLLARDLVVTGSCLERSSDDLPSDLYFFAPAGSESPPADYGERGVALAARPEMLLDVVMGSGSIFPVFPPRTLSDFPRRGESVDLVDGGFAHNSPIEAAVRWGATHIILIEADPRERSNFLENAAGAFNHLYYQAQLVDARSRENEELVIFSLRPEPPHLCMLDFATNLIDAAIEKGYREACGQSSLDPTLSGRRPFRKELGLPLFWSPTEQKWTDSQVGFDKQNR
jgi:predicted acylesterase/phospholipase RssA